MPFLFSGPTLPDQVIVFKAPTIGDTLTVKNPEAGREDVTPLKDSAEGVTELLNFAGLWIILMFVAIAFIMWWSMKLVGATKNLYHSLSSVYHWNLRLPFNSNGLIWLDCLLHRDCRLPCGMALVDSESILGGS